MNSGDGQCDQVAEKEGVFEKNRGLVEFCSGVLYDTWEQYESFVQTVMYLAGATALIFFDSISPQDLGQYRDPYLAIWAVVLAGSALIMACVWRATVQYFAEYECHAAKDDLNKYFATCKIENVTATREQPKARRLYRMAYRVTQVLTIPTLFAGWVMIVHFLLSNLPE